MANDIFDEDGDGSIAGTAQSDIIYGGEAVGNPNGGAVINDTIDGGQSNDTIYGGDGDDLIFGGDAGDAAGGGSGARQVHSFQFDFDKADPVQDGGQAGNIGDSLLYRNVATATDGTSVNVRITVVNQSDPDLEISLGHSSSYPIFLYGGNEGTKVDVRVDFMDDSGNPITIDSNFTFRDVDYYGEDNKEGVTFDTTDITSYAVSDSPATSVQVDDRGDEIEFTTNAGGDTADENLWTQVFFEGQSSLNFTLESRESNAGYGFDTANFAQSPIITEVDASGDDLLYGGAGEDSVLGGGGEDTLYGDAGNDRLDGGEGADSLFGGAGDDTFISSGGGDLINGGTDLDVVDYSGSDTAVTVDLGAGTASTGDTLIGIDGVIGSEFGDSLAGFDHSGGGSDRFTNILYGAGGDDTLVGRGSDDTLHGGEGADSVFGGAGNDTIYGDEGADVLYAGDGEDRIISGAGSDTVFGGAGSDRFEIENLPDTDTFFGGEGADTLDASNFDSGVNLELISTSGGSIDAGDGSVVFEGVERVILSDGADTVSADANVGDITIEAAAGDDTIQTGAGDDTIFAGAGNDTINGGAGDNVLTGGEGRDVFVLEGKDYSELGTEAEIKEAILASNLSGIDGWRGIKGEIGNVEPATRTEQPASLTTGGNADVFDVKKIGDAVEKAMKPLVGKKDAKEAEKTVEDALKDLLESEPGRTFAAKDLSDLAFDVLKEDFGTIKGGIGALGAFGEANEQVEDSTRFDLTDIDVNALSNNVRDALREEIPVNDANALRNDIRDALNVEIEAGNGVDVSPKEIAKIVYNVVDETESKSIAKLASEQAYESLLEQTGVSAPTYENTVDTSSIAEGILDLANHTEITDFQIGEDSLDLSALDYLGSDGLSTNDVKILDTEGDGSGDAILALPDGSTITLRGISVYDLDPEALESMGFNESDDASQFQNAFLEEAGSIGGGGGNDVISGGTGDDTIAGGTGDDTVAGGEGNDTIYGGTGNDSLTTGTGDDTLFGGSGDDNLANSSGDDILYGGTGNDTVTASLGDDTLYGETGNDGLIGGADNDVLYGGTGDDSLVGGAEGAPTATKFSFEYFETDGESNSTLADVGFDSTGNTTRNPDGHGNVDNINVNALDVAEGGDGETFAVKYSTVLTVTTGGSYTFTTTSDDGSKLFVNGTEIVDNDGIHASETQSGSLALGAGEHVVEIIYFEATGGQGLSATVSGPDTGGSPIDIATANIAASDDDLLLGEAGNDQIDGGLGDDTIYGGDDQDTVTVQDNFGSDTVYGGEGGTDGDTLDLSALGTGITVTFTGAEQGTFTDGTDTGSFFEIERIIGTAQDDNVAQTGFLGARTIFGGGGNDILDGGQSADLLYGGTGNDDLEGGLAADTLYGGAGDDSFNGGDDTDTVYGGTGNDFVLTGRGDDLIYGGDGDDVIFEGEGEDTIYGGLGSDTVQGPVHGANDVFYGGEDVGDGDIDTIDLQLEGAQSISLTGTESGTIFGGGTFFEVEQFNLSNSSDSFDGSAATGGLSVSGSFGDDSITGGSGADTLNGGDNQDLLYGGAGADVLYGGEDNNILDTDTLYGGDGDDSIYSLDSAGTDTTNGDILFGGAGSDTLVGAIAADTLFGGADSDSIDGGAGSDSIDGGSGNDTLYGGAGDDTLEGGGGGGSDDLVYGGSGDDVFITDFGSNTFYGGDDADTFGVGFGIDTIYGGSGGDDRDTISGATADDALTITVTGSESGTFADTEGDTGSFEDIEAFELTTKGDTISGAGATSDVTIVAGDGADSIALGSGNDSIDGGTGDDQIFFGDGDNLVYGGDGNDLIDDQSGNPGFTGNNTIYGGDGRDTVFATDGVDTIFGGADRDVIVGGGGDDVIDAGTGNDTIDGGVGNDSIAGGTGNDQLNGNQGNDTLTGGAGDDTIILSNNGGDDVVTDFGAGDDRIDSSALTDAGNVLTNQDGTVTADEVIVSGGGGSAQVLTFPNGETLTVPDGTVDTSTTATQFASLVAMGVPPCFAPGTMILTPTGEMPVEDLRIGDLVMTADHGPQPLRWIGKRVETFETREDRNRPILIGKGALGDGFPTRDLVVSPQHRMVISGKIPEILFGQREVMAIAKGLTDLKGVRVIRGKAEITYYALLFDCHQVVFAEGAATESFRPGPTVLESMDEAAHEAIYAIYPSLRDEPVKGLGPAARELLSGRDSRRLARRLAGSELNRAKAGLRKANVTRLASEPGLGGPTV